MKEPISNREPSEKAQLALNALIRAAKKVQAREAEEAARISNSDKKAKGS